MGVCVGASFGGAVTAVLLLVCCINSVDFMCVDNKFFVCVCVWNMSSS